MTDLPIYPVLRESHSIGDLLQIQAEARPDRTYLNLSGRTYTFYELNARSDAVAAGFHALGVRAGDRVALLAPNRPEVVELFFGLAKLGAIQVPLNAFLKGSFLSYQLRQSRASVIVTDADGIDAVAAVSDGLADLRLFVHLDNQNGSPSLSGVSHVDYSEVRISDAMMPAVKLGPTDTMSIMYTSGTTGQPKGCQLSHGYYQRVGWAFGHGLGLTVDDIVFTTLPLFHVAAQVTTVMSGLVFGGSSVIDPVFSASTFMARAAEVNATAAAAVGSMGSLLLAAPPSPADRAHGLQKMVIIPMAPEAQSAFRERFGVDPWSEVYGQSECIPITCTPRLARNRDRTGSGAPMDDLEVGLLDDDDQPVGDGVVGEIAIRPRSRFAMFDGYWDMPEATLAAFRNLWYHTGDYGRRLPSGQIAFVDRKKDALRRRGENISSVELEAAIVEHPKIADAAVHAVPSPLTEDDVKVCVVLVDGASIAPAELFAFFCETLPYYAMPRYVEVLDELPRSTVGRVMKHVLRTRPIDAGVWDFEQLGLRIAPSARRSTPRVDATLSTSADSY